MHAFLTLGDETDFAAFKDKTNSLAEPFSLTEFTSNEGFVSSEIRAEYHKEMNEITNNGKQLSNLFDQLKDRYEEVKILMGSLSVAFEKAGIIFGKIKEITFSLSEVAF